jgi:L-seryl-tRNA(Ser) seleniumtransferase
MRAVRVDKMTLAALEATLRIALDRDLASRHIPLWEFLSTPLDALQLRAERIAEELCSDIGLHASVVAGTAFLGGGSVPVDPLPSFAVQVVPPYPAPFASEASFARALRLGEPPVVARVQAGSVLFDLRAMREDEDARLVDAVLNVCGASPATGDS